MDIASYQMQGRLPVTVLQPLGDVDGRTYQELIGKAREAYRGGAREMVIDLGGVCFVSSAGLVAIHSIARLLHGQEMPDPEAGWGSLHAMGRDLGVERPPYPHLKLVNPQPAVDKVLQTTGFARAFEFYADVEAAVASF